MLHTVWFRYVFDVILFHKINSVFVTGYQTIKKIFVRIWLSKISYERGIKPLPYLGIYFYRFNSNNKQKMWNVQLSLRSKLIQGSMYTY